MLDHIKKHQEMARQQVRNLYAPSHKQFIEKSDGNATINLEKGGEGSKGGKVIGHTSSGKPIYQNFDHKSHDKFTAKDHDDASDKHSTIAFGMTKQDPEKAHHRQQANEHHSMSRVKGNKEHADKFEKNTEKFTSKYPDDAKEWNQATGEIADLHAKMAEHYNETRGSKEEYKMRSGYSKSPSDHNQYHKGGIKHLMGHLSNSQKKELGEHHKNWLEKGEETIVFTTPFEHLQIQKSRIADTFLGNHLSELDQELIEKGKKAAPGEKRDFGGKSYIKTAAGWRPVGKNKGKVKDAHDTIHGKKEEPKHSFKNDDEVDDAYQKIREEIWDQYDDPEVDDEDHLNRDADGIFEQRYGVSRHDLDFSKKE